MALALHPAAPGFSEEPESRRHTKGIPKAYQRHIKGIWHDADGAPGLHLDTAMHSSWLEIHFTRVVTWRPLDPERVLSFE